MNTNTKRLGEQLQDKVYKLFTNTAVHRPRGTEMVFYWFFEWNFSNILQYFFLSQHFFLREGIPKRRMY